MRVQTAFQHPFSGLFLCLLLLPALSSCSLRKKPTSSNQIILEGDANPTFREDPSRAGTIIRHSNEPRHAPRDYQIPQGSPQYQEYQQQSQPQ